MRPRYAVFIPLALIVSCAAWVFLQSPGEPSNVALKRSMGMDSSSLAGETVINEDSNGESGALPPHGAAIPIKHNAGGYDSAAPKIPRQSSAPADSPSASSVRAPEAAAANPEPSESSTADLGIGALALPSATTSAATGVPGRSTANSNSTSTAAPRGDSSAPGLPPGAILVEEDVPPTLPLALQPALQEIIATDASPAEQQAVEAVRQQFLESLGDNPSPEDPQYADTWVSAQVRADQELRQSLGNVRYNQMQLDILAREYQRQLEANQVPQASTGPDPL